MIFADGQGIVVTTHGPGKLASHLRDSGYYTRWLRLCLNFQERHNPLHHHAQL